MNGIVVIDKPSGLTSHDVVARVRRSLGEAKAGHLGTLDPMATGVLPVAIGKATRLIQFLSGPPKVYTGCIRFGWSTETYDREGKRTGEVSEAAVSIEDVRREAAGLTGRILQRPPAFSAKKIGGTPAYRMARQGKAPELTPVEVVVEEFAVTDFIPPVAAFRVTCSPGTYIRSLAHDLGQRLGCGGHLESLRRIRSGQFWLDRAVPLEGLRAEDVIPMDRLLEDWNAVDLDPDALIRTANGHPVPAPESADGWVRLRSPDGRLVAIAFIQNGLAQPRVVLT